MKLFKSIRCWRWRKNGLIPISRSFGFDRGQPIDRYYIEIFLDRNRYAIRGRVLEIGDPTYTKKFGEDRVLHSDVLHAFAGNSEATIIGDLTTGKGVPKKTFDCIILTQTLPFIYDVKSAIMTAFDALTPGGVMLVTLPGISQISRYDMDRWGDFWRFTDASAHRLFRDVFGEENIKIETYGNVFTSCAFLYGLASHELKKQELNFCDPDYQMLITVRATRSKD